MEKSLAGEHPNASSYQHVANSQSLCSELCLPPVVGTTSSPQVYCMDGAQKTLTGRDKLHYQHKLAADGAAAAAAAVVGCWQAALLPLWTLNLLVHLPWSLAACARPYQLYCG